jgi:peptidyl-prolyl cis-trans isomerase C/foldase protein PrsA
VPERFQRRGRGAQWALGLFLLAGCRNAPPPEAKPPPAVAVVNGVPIPVSRLQVEVDRVRRGEDGQSKAEATDVPGLAHALLDSLVVRTIVLQRAKASGISVSEAEVQRATDALADSARKGGEPFNERLNKDGQTLERLSDEMRERLLAGKYVAEQTRTERVSAAEVRAWFDQHRAEFEQPESVHCQQIAVRTPEEAKSILDQLRKGASFDELARAHSTSPDSRKGGDLGWFPRGTMPKVFDDNCYSLGTGKTSGVVASPYGFHIFKVLGRRAPKSRRFDEVKAEVERRAIAEKRGQAERELLKQLRASAEVKIDESAFALLR